MINGVVAHGGTDNEWQGGLDTGEHSATARRLADVVSHSTRWMFTLTQIGEGSS
jgi:hypothetical protein